MDQIPNPHQDRPIDKPTDEASKGLEGAGSSQLSAGHDKDTQTDKDGPKRTLEPPPSAASARPQPRQAGVKITDHNLIKRLDTYSIEDIVELKIARFLDQLGGFYPENMHELIMCKVEKPLIVQILRQVGGNQVHASKILGINRNTLRKKMKLYNIGL